VNRDGGFKEPPLAIVVKPKVAPLTRSKTK
jgi:hypothetical protein